MKARLTRLIQHSRWTVPFLLIAVCVALGAAISSRPAPVQDLSAKQALDEQVQRGRLLVIHHGCGDCHGGSGNPAAPHWLIGWHSASPPGGFQDFQIGPYHVYARNLTPDNMTGMGRFSERQIFNALRYGLRPGETPDVEITSTTPGEGNFPARPKYLAVAMPWPVFRHMSDQELWDIAAYLKYGLKPVNNKVPDSEGPPDFWASEYTPEKIGTYPAAAFPTANEMAATTSGQ